MAKRDSTNEQRYFDALKKITRYMTVDQLRRESDKSYGLTFAEALEFAYENVKDEARLAIRGKRPPTVQAKPPAGGAAAKE